MSKKHQCFGLCHLCLQCGERTFTKSTPSRKKKFCNNKCQKKFMVSQDLGYRTPKWIDHGFIERLYVVEKKSVLDISREIGKSTRQVSRYLARFQVKARPFSTEGIRDEEHWNWQGGKTKEGTLFRNRVEYKRWRATVFKRDNFTCQVCGKRGGHLNADHIKPFATHPELRLSLKNGRTLCIPCHRKTDTFGAKASGDK